MLTLGGWGVSFEIWESEHPEIRSGTMTRNHACMVASSIFRQTREPGRERLLGAEQVAMVCPRSVWPTTDGRSNLINPPINAQKATRGKSGPR